jgi:hypothetical protein
MGKRKYKPASLTDFKPTSLSAVRLDEITSAPARSVVRAHVDDIHNRKVFRYTTMPDGRRLVTLSAASMKAARRALMERDEFEREGAV